MNRFLNTQLDEQVRDAGNRSAVLFDSLPQACREVEGLLQQSTSTVDLDHAGLYRLVTMPTNGGAVIVTGLPAEASASLRSSASSVVVGAAATDHGDRCRDSHNPSSARSVVAGSHAEVAELELHRGEVNLPTPIIDVASNRTHTELGHLVLNRMLLSASSTSHRIGLTRNSDNLVFRLNRDATAHRRRCRVRGRRNSGPIASVMVRPRQRRCAR
ncbi:integral membrane sensor signal transduction histidine kinase domain protein [Mycobacteroides abscessus subsp. bolletii 103]|nr:integral membrane sensor signal transduction histidine kinase domain protein [Mycobacteroides abscessus subsp. bolletii 103]